MTARYCKFEVDGEKCGRILLPSADGVTPYKNCPVHAAAANTARYRRYRRSRADKREVEAESEDVPVYIPRNSPVQETRQDRVPDERGVISYLTADTAPRQASQEIQPRRRMFGERDYMRAAAMRVGERPRERGIDSGLMAEVGETEYRRQQGLAQPQQPNEPHVWDAYFGSPLTGVFVDPTAPDMIDAAWR